MDLPSAVPARTNEGYSGPNMSSLQGSPQLREEKDDRSSNQPTLAGDVHEHAAADKGGAREPITDLVAAVIAGPRPPPGDAPAPHQPGDAHAQSALSTLDASSKPMIASPGALTQGAAGYGH